MFATKSVFTRSASSRAVARGCKAELLGAVLEEQSEPAAGERLSDHANVVAGGKHPLFLDDFVGACEPTAPLFFPCREIARFRESLLIAHSLDDAVELRLLGQPLGIELGHRSKRTVEEAQAPVGIELRGSRRHPV